MTNQGFSKLGFHTLDRITDVFPAFGPRVFQKIFLSIFGSTLSYTYYLKKYQLQLLKTKCFSKILVIVDINIGDAVLLQNCIKIIRCNFPDAQIDYACNRLGGELISELPAVDNVYQAFNGGGIPSGNDMKKLRDTIILNNYDLILNLSPFVNKKSLQFGGNVIQLYILLSAYIFHLLRIKAEHMHISHIIYSFFNDFLKPVRTGNIKDAIGIVSGPSQAMIKGNLVYLSHDAIQTANEFLQKHNIYSLDRILLFNPDVTVKYSMIPFEIQIQILKKILVSDDIDYVLIAAAYSNPGLEENILRCLPDELLGKVIIVPHMNLSSYTALIDLCDVFLTGDTGPLHIAASWKEPLDEKNQLKNHTVVISIIGPTNSRLFCYDSTKPGHIPANQDAPSKVFVGEAPCRNITCLNKTGKTCKEIRCFMNIDPDKISSYIISYFHLLRVSVRKMG
jgi:ADP-heptose:LPS heptosyltransferase